MRFAFTEHVRHLTLDTTAAQSGFDAVWEKMRSAVVAELRRRSLLGAPPACLGIYGSPPPGWRAFASRPSWIR